MALTALAGHVWVPAPTRDAAFGSATYVIDASGEKAALILRCPKAGTLDRFDFRIGTVTISPTAGLRASFQGVNASGLPDGTILGGTNNAFVTYANPVTTGWKSTNFGETVTVTRGQLIACVVDIPTFIADSVALSHLSVGPLNFPYGVSATSTKQATAHPIMMLHYTDGYVSLGGANVFAADSRNVIGYAVNTGTADEWGLAFQVPVPSRLSEVAILLSLSAGGDFEVILYDAADTILATAIAHDGDHTANTDNEPHYFFFSDAVDLSANTLYRLTVRPTTTTALFVTYYDFASLALMDTWDGGQNCYMTSRLNQAGSWTDYNTGGNGFRRPRFHLGLSAFDSGGGSGGGAPIISTATTPIIRAA